MKIVCLLLIGVLFGGVLYLLKKQINLQNDLADVLKTSNRLVSYFNSQSALQKKAATAQKDEWSVEFRKKIRALIHLEIEKYSNAQRKLQEDVPMLVSAILMKDPPVPPKVFVPKTPKPKPLADKSPVLDIFEAEDFLVEMPLQPLMQESQSEMLPLYASAANQDDCTFYKVTADPDEDTIFLLTLTDADANKALFEVYPSACSKVLKRQNFLETACEVQNLGSQKVTVEEKGEAQKQEDSKWKIVQPAKIKFE
ncbi:MAG: hypothetical protein EZS26_000201 [Candidatus Ordinivivax streblomastigis]|uniref:Uncharacterized protein n=1 Tax=Candidatus Ordinivivax streblomastigis TaxID=2540710 RepID=A0A5M8P605_9BACT|nr:MAG: hypothetical protein EZS26_000201 [Candidatus Ordinivivax streblomastigis]